MLVLLLVSWILLVKVHIWLIVWRIFEIFILRFQNLFSLNLLDAGNIIQLDDLCFWSLLSIFKILHHYWNIICFLINPKLFEASNIHHALTLPAVIGIQLLLRNFCFNPTLTKSGRKRRHLGIAGSGFKAILVHDGTTVWYFSAVQIHCLAHIQIMPVRTSGTIEIFAIFILLAIWAIWWPLHLIRPGPGGSVFVIQYLDVFISLLRPRQLMLAIFQFKTVIHLNSDYSYSNLRFIYWNLFVNLNYSGLFT